LALSRIWDRPVIDKDSLTSPLLTGGVSPELAGPASYALMIEIAHDLLVTQHLSVILDSPGRFPFVFERLKEIQCEALRQLRHQRLTSREARLSQWRGDAGLS
jgi:hypothetical protein